MAGGCWRHEPTWTSSFIGIAAAGIGAAVGVMRSIAIEELLQIEQIRQLKTLYCLAVDSKDWELYRSLFTDDAQLAGGLPSGGNVEPATMGPEEWIASVAAVLGATKTMHTLHASIVRLSGADAAEGLWQYSQRGWGRTGGYYSERYRRGSEGWKIAEMRIAPIFANDGHDESESAPGSIDEVSPLWSGLLERWRSS